MQLASVWLTTADERAFTAGMKRPSLISLQHHDWARSTLEKAQCMAGVLKMYVWRGTWGQLYVW